MRQTKRTPFMLSLLVLLSATTLACGPQMCSGEVVVSIMVTVVDEDGHGIEDPKLVVEFQRGAEQPWEACDNESRMDETTFERLRSARWRCGGEVAGTLNVRATLGEMSGRTDGVRVKADACHVQTREVEVVLQ